MYVQNQINRIMSPQARIDNLETLQEQILQENTDVSSQLFTEQGTLKTESKKEFESKIADLQKQLDELKEELKNAKNEEISNRIKVEIDSLTEDLNLYKSMLTYIEADKEKVQLGSVVEDIAIKDVAAALVQSGDKIDTGDHEPNRLFE